MFPDCRQHCGRVSSSTGRLLGASVVGAVATSMGGGITGYQAAFTGLVFLGVLILVTAATLKSRTAELATA